MRKNGKFFSAFLAVLLLLSLFSITAFADSGSTTLTTTIPCTVTLQVGDHGKVTVDGTDYTGNASFQRNAGTVVTYTFDPNGLYSVDKVIYDGTEVTSELSGNTWTAPALTGNAALSVSFKLIGGGTPTYTVTFDANGHGTAPAAQTVLSGTTATKPTDPTVSGWTFEGWYKEAACTNAFDFATPITGDITLFAKWTEKDDGGDEPPVPVTYTVTFDANGHGTAPASQTVESGKTATKPADPTASGWSFGGWYKEAACTNAFDFSTPITGDITLYAKWTEKDDGGDEPPVVTKFTITYNLNGGTMDGKTGTVTVQVEDGATITLPKPTRSGYTFDYWEGSRYEAGASYKVTGDHTFTAQWKANTTPTNPDTGGTPGSPKTGDDSHAGLWIVLMIASLAGIGGVTFYSRKRRTSR